MARPISQGAGYFPLDCQLDESMKLLEAEHGLIGFGLIVKLWQEIYAVQGYYTSWAPENALLWSHDLSISNTVVTDIVQTALRRGLFNKSLFEQYGILTSRGIQSRWLEIVKRRRLVAIVPAFWLLDPPDGGWPAFAKNENVNINPVSVYINPSLCIHDVDNNEQRKVKENKGKKSSYSGGRAAEKRSYDLDAAMETAKRVDPTRTKRKQ